MMELVSNLWSIPLIVIIPLITAVIVNAIYDKEVIKYISIASALITLGISIISPYGYHWFTGHPAFDPNTFTFTFDPGIPAFRLSLEFVYGPIQQIMIVISSLILVFCVILATVGLTKRQGPYMAMIFLLFASAAIIIMVNDLYHLWIAVEIGSLIVVGVVVVSGTSISHKAALKYAFFSAISGAGLAVALALLLGITGFANVSDIIRIMNTVGISGMEKILYISFGFFILAWMYAGGLAPIHPLKSEVYGASYPHATAVLQAQSKLMLVAIGIIMLRIFGTLPFIKEVMIFLSVITMILGVVLALIQIDFRWIIAYLIISHSGLVTLGIALGTKDGIIGGVFQAVNDIIYMSVLLFCCEALYYFGGATSTKNSFGIARKSPWLCAAVLLGAFAAAGMPPFNGFQSEIILIQASLNSGLPEIAVIILMVSITTLIALLRAIYRIFLKPPEVEVLEAKIPKAINFGIWLFIILTIIIGVYPDIALRFIIPAVEGGFLP
ncbi:MAG: proton-conducting transporter membrane subunit [Candidatus Methanomethyliaceae archaeon]